MRTFWRVLACTSGFAPRTVVSRWVVLVAVFVGTLLGFEARALACTTNLDCSGSTPICDPLSQTCRACASNLECVGLPGTVCMTAGPLAGQCVLGDAGLLDAGQDSETSEAGSDSESDATSGGADGGADATPDVDESGADAPGASHGNSGDAGEQDGGAVASPPPDGGADSGLGATADVDVSADSAAEDSTVTSDGAAADARSSDAAISSDNNDGNASLARDAGDAGVPADSRGETADTSSEPTQLPTFEGGGGCACRAAPKPASHQALVLPFLGLALWIRRRRASKAHSSLSSCDATVGGTTMWRLTSKSNATKGPDRARAHILSIRSILKGQEPRHQVGDDDPTQAATPRAKRASEGRVKARFDDADDFPFWWVV